MEEILINKQTIIEPNKYYSKMYRLRFGKILSNLSIACSLYIFLSVLALSVSLAYYLIVLCLIVGSLGIVLLNETFRSIVLDSRILITSSGIVDFYINSIEYVSITAFAFAMISIIFFVFDDKRHTKRIITVSILSIIALVLGVIK